MAPHSPQRLDGFEVSQHSLKVLESENFVSEAEKDLFPLKARWNEGLPP